jgi:hypothetical protein
MKIIIPVFGLVFVHATDEFAPLSPPPIPVLPEWSPVKVFGGCGAPLDLRKAARAGVPVAHEHGRDCLEHGCAHALQQLFSAAEKASNRYAGL